MSTRRPLRFRGEFRDDLCSRLLGAAATVSAAVGAALLAPVLTVPAPHHGNLPAPAPAAATSTSTGAAAASIRPTPAPRPLRPAAPATSTRPTTSTASGTAEPDTTLDPRPWLEVARGYATDLATPGASHDDWLTRLRRWTTPELADQHALTAAERIPDATLLDLTPIPPGDTVVDVVAQYDTGPTVAIRVETGPDGQWTVTAAAPTTRPG